MVGPLLPAQIKAVMLMEEKHNLRPVLKAGRKTKHGGTSGLMQGIRDDAQSLSMAIQGCGRRSSMAVPDEEMDSSEILWDTRAPGTSCSMYGKFAWGTA